MSYKRSPTKPADSYGEFENLPTQEGSRKSTGFWSDDYRHRTPPNARKGVTLRTHRKGK